MESSATKKIKLTSEEKFRQFVLKFRPYFQNIWSAKWKLLIFNFVIFVLAAVYLKFFVKNYYESTVNILPEYGSKSSLVNQYSGLAAMAGIKVGETNPTEIYKHLLTSETVLFPVIYNKYYTKEYKGPLNLIYIFDIKPDKELNGEKLKRQLFIDTQKYLLKEVISTDLERSNKILTLKVKAPESLLSAEIANKIVQSLDDYVRNKRKSYAKDQLFYIQKRTRQVKDSLTLIENKLEKFKDYNRITEQSPELLLEQSRLLRAIEILNTVYVELNKQLELAKIDEIKDTPIINICEFANDPVIKAGPRRTIALMVVMFISILLSSIYLIFKNTLYSYYNIVRTS